MRRTSYRSYIILFFSLRLGYHILSSENVQYPTALSSWHQKHFSGRERNLGNLGCLSNWTSQTSRVARKERASVQGIRPQTDNIDVNDRLDCSRVCCGTSDYLGAPDDKMLIRLFRQHFEDKALDFWLEMNSEDKKEWRMAKGVVSSCVCKRDQAGLASLY